MKTFSLNISILVSVVFMRTMGDLLYSTSLPAIKHMFHASPINTQLTVASFYAGIAITQLIYGAISDYYNRKTILMASLVIFGVGSFLCATASNIYFFIFCRILQGFGMGGNFSITARILNDTFLDEKLLAKHFSIMDMAFAFSLIINPLIGGFIQESVGWEGNFLFMGFYSFLIFSLLLFLFKEPRSNVKVRKLYSSEIAHNCIFFLTQKSFISSALILAIFSSFLLYAKTIYPFFVENILHLPIIKYSLFMFFVGVAYIIGIFSNIFLLYYFNIKLLGKLGIILAFIGSFMLALFIELNIINIFTLFIPLIFASFGSAFVFPNIMTLITSRYKSIAGLCSAYIGFILYILPSVSILYLKYLNIDTPFSFAFCGMTFWLFTWIFFTATSAQIIQSSIGKCVD